MLSPYTPWAIKLDVESPNLLDSIRDLFLGEKNLPIEVHLVGRGQYILSNTSQKEKNWDLRSYRKNNAIKNPVHTCSEKVTEIHTLCENAVAQKDNKNYFYQGTDIHTIVQSEDMRKELEGTQFIQGMQYNHLQSKLDEIVKYAFEDKPVLCIYNLSNIHWVTFCVIKKEDGELIILYKDSFGRTDGQLVTLLKNLQFPFRTHPENEQAGDGSCCGIMALQNLRIMAREIKKDCANFIENFEAQKFCSLAEARNLRKNEFPNLYLDGENYQAHTEAEARKRTIDLSNSHQSKLDQIINHLRLHKGDSFVIQQEEVKSNAQKTIAVEIGANDSTLTTFHYRIQASKDLSILELESILCQVYPWQNGNHYTIENGIVKVKSSVQL
jgi:hypothetical protein